MGIWSLAHRLTTMRTVSHKMNRYEWVDDLSVLEVINLVSIGISSYNFKQHVASDIPSHGQYVNNQDLKTQKYLKQINQWTENQKMELNQKKTKAMIVILQTIISSHPD